MKREGRKGSALKEVDAYPWGSSWNSNEVMRRDSVTTHARRVPLPKCSHLGMVTLGGLALVLMIALLPRIPVGLFLYKS